MERGAIKGSACVPVLKKLEECRSVGFTKRSYNTVRRQRRHRQEGPKRINKPKPDEVKQMVLDAGSSLYWPAREGSCRDKPKPDEVNKIVVDSGSKEESMAQLAGEGKRRRKKLVTKGVADLIIRVEIVDYMLGEPLQPVPVDTIPEFDFDFGVSDLLMESIEENAYVLRQYRTNKYTEFLTNEDASQQR